MRLARHSFLVPVFLLFACVGVFAQQNSEINGTVTDPSSAAIPGAHVTLTETGTGFVRDADTNSAGFFSFPALNVGSYNLTVAAKGFEKMQEQGLVLNVSQTLRHDVHMTVGTDAQTVTVQANALTVQTDSNVVSNLISSEQISKIATENRNFAALAALGLGVSSALPSNNTPTSVASNFTISVNGLRQSHNIWLIDGGEADDRGGAGGMDIMPSQDAIAQFETLSSNYPPDYGISSGATITLALKSGTQHFHGEAFEFNRNADYDANCWLCKQSNPVTPRPKLNYNIFGFNIGGPLFIPKVYNTDRKKTFFFWNEEWRRLIQGSNPNKVATINPADIPTAGQDLTYVAPAFAPTTTLKVPTIGDPAFNAKLASLGLVPGQPFPNNTIPAALFDPNAVIYLNSGIIPKPNISSGYIVSTAVQPINVRDDIVRIDHRLSDKWQILGHYMHDSVTQAYAQPMLGWLWASYNTVTSTLSNPSNSAAIKLSGTMTPDLLLEVSMNYDGNIINITNSPNSNLPSGFNVNRFFNNGSKSLPGITGFGAPYSTAEDLGSAPWHNAAEDYDPKVDLSWTKGRHATKFGFGYNRYTKNQQLFGDKEGDFGFGAQSNDSMMDMLMGIASSYSQYQDLPIRHYVNQTTSFYAMDNWHVTQRLSLQLGFRYDALPHAWERGNNVANFNPAAYDPAKAPVWLPDGSMDPTGPGFSSPTGSTPFYLNGVQLAGRNGTPRGLVKNDWNTWQPRVGFAMDVFGTGKTVVRGGFGTFYERMQGNDIYNAATTPPFAYNPSASNVYFSDPHTSWQTGATAATPFFASGVTNLSPYYPAPAVAQYSLGVQDEIAPSVVVVVQYVGNAAWHQNIERRINNFPLSTPMNIRANAGDGANNSGTNPGGANLANPNMYRTYQGFSTITQQENTTNGSYNGFQTGIRAQNKHGLSGELDYTWSHEVDITSYDLNQVSNPFDLKYDKGSGALDRRHMLSLNYVYQLPVFNHATGLTHSLLGGWEVAGTAIFEKGVPVPSGLAINYDPIGLGGDYTNRPNLSGKVKYPKTAKAWFDPTSFSVPTPAWQGGPNQGFGNAGKDAIVGPGRLNFDTSLYKSFAIREAAHFEFRAESFNTFNHTQFNSISSSLNVDNKTGLINNNFGQVTNTQDPRVLEFGAKLVF